MAVGGLPAKRVSTGFAHVREVLIGPGFLRLALALIVFVSHCSSIAVGRTAVYTFFCLSGYWIYRMWTGRYVHTRTPYLTYCISRAWRLLPTFLLICALTTLFRLSLGESPRELVGNDPLWLWICANLTLFGYNLLTAPVIGPAWSLDVEMQLYLMAPLLVALAMRAPGRLLAAAATVSLVSWLLVGREPVSTYVVFFACGAAAAAGGWKPDTRLAGALLLMALLVAVVIALGPWHGMLVIGRTHGPLNEYNEALNIALSAMVMPFAIFTTRQRGGERDGACADLSYIIYLLHAAGIFWFTRFDGTFGQRLPYVVTIWVLVPAASVLIWRYYDLPINRARARWVGTRDRRVPGGKLVSAPTSARQQDNESSSLKPALTV